MVTYKYSDLLLGDSVDKQLVIVSDDLSVVITNEELHSQEFELTETLCSDSQLRFGCCEASCIKFKISNIFIPLKNKWLTVSTTLNGNTDEPFLFGRYKVESDKPTADRICREVTAYDAMYDILQAEVADWYNMVLPDADSAVTLKQFRDSFLAKFGIEQEEVALPNDSMIVTKTVEPTSLSGQTVITTICEINGCFGHIGRNGKFQYIFLREMVEGLYPRDDLYPAEDLFPADPMNVSQISGDYYISAEYEDFVTEKINKLQIRQEEGDIGCIYGEGDNCYIIQDNFLVYGKSTDELDIIAANIYNVIHGVWYRPATVEAKGNPCLEVGDGIKLRTRYEIVYTYILQRTLKGIQALTDSYVAEGEQYQSERVNSVRDSIIQLKGKTNKLTRTLEETRSEITDIEQNLSTRIVQNAQDILLEAQRASEAEGTLAAQIAVNAQQILLKVSKDNIISEINQTAEKITISASKIDLVGVVNADELVSKFATITTLNSTKASLETLISQKATITQLDATNGEISKLYANEAALGDLIATKATIDQLNSVSATVNTINANYATVSQVNAVNANISAMLTSRAQFSGYVGIIGTFNFMNRGVKWGTINGIACLVENT